MSDSDSDTDSDNNNVFPFYNQFGYLGLHSTLGHENPELEMDIDLDMSSSSDSILDHHSDSSSGNSDVQLHNSTDDSDNTLSNDEGSSNSSNCSSLFAPFSNRAIGDGIINVKTPKPNWCFPRELYKREIGLYKQPSMWANKFYQSIVGVQKLKLSMQLKGHDGCVNSLNFNPAGDMIASGSDDLKICLWDWSTEKCLLKYDSEHAENVFQTKFISSQGEIRIVSSARDGVVRLSAVSKSDVHYNKVIARHDRSATKLSVHDDLPYVVLSCGEDGVVKNIDIRESPINENESITNILHVRNSNGTAMRLYGIDINPMKPLEFIVNGDDEYVRMYDKRKLSPGPVKKFHRVLHTATNSSIPTPQPQDLHITSAVYNYCGTEILASYSEDDIYLFDVNGSPDTYLHHYGGHLNRVTLKSVNFYGPKSDFVVSGSDCGHIYIWDKNTEAIVQRKHADANGIVNVLEPHPHMPTLATSGLDKTIKIWQPLNKCQQPNVKKLKLSVIKNRRDRDRRLREIIEINQYSLLVSSRFLLSRF